MLVASPAAAQMIVSAGTSPPPTLVTTEYFKPIRVNCAGGNHTDPDGHVWAADYGYLNGTTSTTTHAISGTSDQIPYQSERWGNPLNYAFTVTNGTYQVILHFAETYYSGVGQRIFNVALEGTTVLSNFDIFAEVGADAALVKTYTVTVTDGTLNIDMTASVDNAKICGIEIYNLSDILVNAGGSDYTDVAGNLWSADVGYVNGKTFSTTDAISGTLDDPLYQSERYNTSGNLHYAFEVPDGSYSIKLYFAEIYSGTWSVGARVFDIQLQGATVLSSLDIYSEVGGDAALIKTFPVTVTDGWIDIQFLTNIQAPQINAIQIIGP